MKRNSEIKYIGEDEIDWIGKVISRAGKSMGKYASHWNVTTEGCVEVLDFEKKAELQNWLQEDLREEEVDDYNQRYCIKKYQFNYGRA